jgi:hypothetical protein
MGNITEKINSLDSWVVNDANDVVGVQRANSGVFTEFIQRQNEFERRERGAVQTLRVLAGAAQSQAAAFTYVNTVAVEGEYNAVRFCYANYGVGTYTITSAKTAASPSLTDNGTGLTWSSVTFDDVATAKCGDTWDGTLGAATNYVVPAAISGTGANTVPNLVWSDWIAQTPVPCTDAGMEDLRLITHRVYSASTSYSVANSSTSASNMGDYNANSRRKMFGLLVSGDQVGTISSQTPQANWQWAMCVGFQALLIKPIYNHGVFGDAISKGQGSFDNNNGAWGWAQQGPQGLTDSGLGAHSVVNYAAAGQGKAATWANFLNVISQGGLDTATMFPWSPTDGISAGSSPWNLNNFKFHVRAFISECRKYGAAPIIATQPPSITITDSAGDAIRVAINAEIRAMKGVAIADFDAILSTNTSPARYITGLTNTDNQHPSLLGHRAMAVEYQRAIRAALSL